MVKKCVLPMPLLGGWLLFCGLKGKEHGCAEEQLVKCFMRMLFIWGVNFEPIIMPSSSLKIDWLGKLSQPTQARGIHVFQVPWVRLSSLGQSVVGSAINVPGDSLSFLCTASDTTPEESEMSQVIVTAGFINHPLIS